MAASTGTPPAPPPAPVTAAPDVTAAAQTPTWVNAISSLGALAGGTAGLMQATKGQQSPVSMASKISSPFPMAQGGGSLLDLLNSLRGNR